VKKDEGEEEMARYAYKEFHLTGQGEVYNLPHSNPNKAYKELAGRHALKVSMFYETENRKPAKLIKLDFERNMINSDGVVVINKKEDDLKEVFNLEFAFYSGPSDETNPKDRKVVPFPSPPTLPTKEESQALLNYIKKSFPLLAEGAPSFIQKTIDKYKEIHLEKIEFVRNM